MENKAELVFMPGPGMGHIVSMVEFAKRLHDQDQCFSITFLLIGPSHFPFYNLYVESLAASDTRFRYVHLLHHPVGERSGQDPSVVVVFLCFGSLGYFGQPQPAEIAAALEKSGHRFLWSKRRPPPQGEFEMPTDCGGDYQGLLPEGFLQRTENRGMVCGWAPQTTVLGHAAVGGFVSHCGWNSILESLWVGVPIVTWPMYAEQQMNAFEMVVDLDLAVELRLDYRNELGGSGGGVELLAAEEIERAVRCVMDGENLVRKRMREMREKSREAVVEGGSSFGSFDDMLGNH
ncbi:hypothetical protein ACSBR2_005249 [Camellia fascicularis]